MIIRFAIERPRLRPYYYAVPLATDRAQLRSAHRSVVVNGPGAASLLQRVLPFSLALAIINTPQVLFLDEPTTGLDPEARRDTWTLVRSLSAKGTSVLLSTHDIADAEPVSDRVGVMVNGRLLALESPQRLIGASGEARPAAVAADEQRSRQPSRSRR